MRRYLRAVMIAVVMSSLWVSPAIGQDLGGLESFITGSTRGDGPGTLMLLLLKGIGLTPEQKQQVKSIFIAHRGNLETLFRELQAANAELTKTLFAEEEVNAADIAPHAEHVTLARQQLLQEGLTVVLEVRQVLTPEQRVKAARLREQLQKLQGALTGSSQQHSGGTAP